MPLQLHSGNKYEITVWNVKTGEALAFADQIRWALKFAGWKVNEPNDPIAISKDNFGVWVFISTHPSNGRMPIGAVALREALLKVGVETYGAPATWLTGDQFDLYIGYQGKLSP